MSTDTGYKVVAIVATLSLLLLLGYFGIRNSEFATSLLNLLKPRSADEQIAETAKPLTLPELVKRVKPSVVEIITYDAAGNPDAVGSGFFSGPQQVVSNWHVVENAFRAEVKTADGGVYAVSGIVGSNREADLVMLEVEIAPNRVSALRLSSTQPEEGEKIVVIGNPLGLEGTISDGIVSGIRDVPKFGRMLQLTAPISRGSSGGPVVNLIGEVVGVASGALMDGQNLNFAVPGDQIVALERSKLVSFLEMHHREAIIFFDRAFQLASAGSCNLAIPLFKRAIDEDHDYEDAWLELGICQSESSSYEEALEALKQVIRINPNSDRAYVQVAKISSELQLSDEALKFYRQATVINPKNEDAHYGLSIALYKIGDIDGAHRAYVALRKLNSGRAQELSEVFPEILGQPQPQERDIEGTITLDVDPTTGLIGTPTCPTIRTRTFAIGSEPSEYCGPEFHKGSRVAPSTSRPRVMASPALQ